MGDPRVARRRGSQGASLASLVVVMLLAGVAVLIWVLSRPPEVFADPATGAVSVEEGRGRRLPPPVSEPSQPAPMSVESASESAESTHTVPPDAAAVAPGLRPPEAWEKILSTADALTYGTITQEQLIDLTLGLLDQWDPTQAPRSEQGGGLLAFDLLGDQAGEGATLYLCTDPALRKYQAEFSIKARFDVAPGAYVDDGSHLPTRSRLDIAFSLDDEGQPGQFSGLAQNQPHHSSDSWARVSAANGPVPIGGLLDIQADGAIWRQITLEAKGTAEEPEFTSTLATPTATPGELANPQLQQLKSRFLAVRNQAGG